jgi:4-aminobutyrate aminotransferase-like enzyme
VGDVRKRGLENGILLGIGGVKKNVLKIKPPLIITAAEADTALELFRKSLKQSLETRARTER